MEKIDSLNQVAAFHHLFQHPVLTKPSIPDSNRCALRISLLQEELEELSEAIEERDIVGIADALCDLQYVLSGAVLEFGLGNLFKKLFDEVQRSNMSKACDSEEDAVATVEYYANERQTKAFYKEVDGKWLVYREGDHKTLKSIRYTSPNLEEIINKTQ